MKIPLSTFLLTMVLLGFSAPGFAQAPDPAIESPLPPGVECSEYVPPEERRHADRLAVRGVACFESGEYLLALRHYREARRLSNSNLLNAAIGRVFQELGYPFIARRYYRDYLGGRIDSEGRQRIEQRLAVVEAELRDNGTDVAVESSPPEARVFIVVKESHWEDLGRTPLTIRLTPGKHEFILQNEGYLTQTRDVAVSEGEKRESVEAAFVATDAAWGIPGRTLRRAGVVGMAASIPLLATGASLFAVGSMKRANGEQEPGARLQQWGAVSTIVGLVSLGAGATLWFIGRPKESLKLSDPASESAPKRSARIIPLIGLGTLGARVEF